MNIAIVGSRGWTDYITIHTTIDQLFDRHTDLTIVSGGARGADRIAAAYARKRGIAVMEYHADWRRHGRKAGPLRNQEIVAAAHEVIAFWDGKSRGTKNTLKLAGTKGIPATIILSGSGDQPEIADDDNHRSEAQLSFGITSPEQA